MNSRKVRLFALVSGLGSMPPRERGKVLGRQRHAEAIALRLVTGTLVENRLLFRRFNTFGNDRLDALLVKPRFQRIAVVRFVTNQVLKLSLDHVEIEIELRERHFVLVRRMRGRRQVGSATLLDGHRQWLAERAPAVRYSARSLYQELIREHEFTGCSGFP